MSVTCVACALRRMKALAKKVEASENNVLQYNRDRDELVNWEWYVQRITDPALVKYSMATLKANESRCQGGAT